MKDSKLKWLRTFAKLPNMYVRNLEYGIKNMEFFKRISDKSLVTYGELQSTLQKSESYIALAAAAA